MCYSSEYTHERTLVRAQHLGERNSALAGRQKSGEQAGHLTDSKSE